MRFRIGLVAAAALVLTIGLAHSAVENATVTAASGDITVVPGGKTLAAGDQVNQGDTITLGAGANMTVTFADGATMDVVGPASFRMTTIEDVARTVDLIYGSVNRLEAKDVVIGIRTPYDSFVAAQNSTIAASVSASPDGAKITYFLLEGENAKVVDGQQLTVMSKDSPVVVNRPKEGGATPLPGAGESAKLELGSHLVEVFPKDGFGFEQLPGGGVKITRTGEGFGLVNVDENTSFYLAPGDYVQFDASGNVTAHNGIVHVYAPLDYMGLYDEPIKGPASASFTGTKTK
jgi:hypothetical protein